MTFEGVQLQGAVKIMEKLNVSLNSRFLIKIGGPIWAVVYYTLTDHLDLLV